MTRLPASSFGSTAVDRYVSIGYLFFTSTGQISKWNLARPWLSAPRRLIVFAIVTFYILIKPKSRLVPLSFKLLLVMKLPVSDHLSLTSMVFAYGRFYCIYRKGHHTVKSIRHCETSATLCSYVQCIS